MGNLKKILLAGTALFASSIPATADPLSIGIAVLVNIGYGGAISGFGATLLGSAILGAIGLGASLLSSALFSPKPAEIPSSDRQATARQSVGARVRFYGRVKTGGTLWFFETKDGTLYVGVTLNEGEISGVVEWWLNDQLVTTDADGQVNEAPYVFTDNGNTYRVARLLAKYGTAEQTVFSLLDSVFPEVDESHRNRGVALALGQFQEVPRDQISNVYPQLNPNIRVVQDASLVYKVREGFRGWSDNAGDVIYDYLTGMDGAGFQYGAGYDPDEVEIASFQAFANLSYQPVTLKGGGIIPRYSINGSYGLNEEMRDVLPRMLAACDGELYMNSVGKIAIRGGQWVDPELVLDDSLGHIISGEFRRGQQALAAFNELTTIYVEPRLDYQEAEAQPWVDSGNIALRGRPVQDRLDLQMVTHHAQARRLAKIHSAKQNPEWIGTVVTNYYGMNAIDESVVRIKFAPFEIDAVFRIVSCRPKDDMTGVELTLSSISPSAYEWDAELEEGTAPGQPPDTGSPIDLPPPEDIVLSIQERSVSGSVAGLYIRVTWTEPDRTALGQDAEYRELPSGDWLAMSVSDSVGLAESGIVNDGSDYQVRVRTRSPAGATGPWTDPPFEINASI